MTVEERKKQLVSGGYSLTLAVEGRTTNLKIWLSHIHAPIVTVNNPLAVYMRLDKYKEYNVPVSEDSVGYLQKPNDIVAKLATFGFPAPLEKLDEILQLTEKLKERDLLEW